MTSLEDLIARAAASSSINREAADALCEREKIRSDDLWNRLAVTIARRFQAGEMSFDDADAAMNAIDTEMTEDAIRAGEGYVFPEPAFSIYEAFDAGEYDHGDGADPVEKYTRPALATILRKA